MNLHRSEHTGVIYHLNNRVGQEKKSYFSVCVYMCVVYACVCMPVCMFAQRPEVFWYPTLTLCLVPWREVSLNMKFTVLVRLSSQLAPSMPLPRVLECGHPQFYMGAGVSNSGYHVCTATSLPPEFLESPSSELWYHISVGKTKVLPLFSLTFPVWEAGSLGLIFSSL